MSYDGAEPERALAVDRAVRVDRLGRAGEVVADGGVAGDRGLTHLVGDVERGDRAVQELGDQLFGRVHGSGQSFHAGWQGTYAAATWSVNMSWKYGASTRLTCAARPSISSASALSRAKMPSGTVGVEPLDPLGADQQLDVVGDRDALRAHQHVHAGGRPLEQPAAVEPPVPAGDVGGGAEAEHLDRGQRDLERADGLDDRRHHRIVRPHPAVDEPDPAELEPPTPPTPAFRTPTRTPRRVGCLPRRSGTPTPPRCICRRTSLAATTNQPPTMRGAASLKKRSVSTRTTPT